MRRPLLICLLLLMPMAAVAQYDPGFATRISSQYTSTAITSGTDWNEDFPDTIKQLELAFSAGTSTSTLLLAPLPRTGALLVQTVDEHKPAKAIPVQIISSLPATDDPGLVELMDGLVVASGDRHAFLLAPTAWDSASLADGLAEWGTLVQTDDGRLEITNPASEPALHFSATFTFRGIRKTGRTGALVLQPPHIRNSNSNEHFYTVLYADGSEEILQPIIADPKLMNTLAAQQLLAEFNRNTGVVTINNRNYRPSYFVEELQPEISAYLEVNGVRGIAFRPEDINKDGLMDYQVISSIGSQWLFGQP